MQLGDSLNLARLAETARERLGDYESVVYEEQVYRSGQLHERAVHLGAGLTALGLEPGDRVVVLMANCPEVTVTYQAVWRAGGVVTPVMFLVGPDELGHILADSAARIVVTSRELLNTLAWAAPAAAALRHVVVADELDGEVPQLPGSVRLTTLAQVEAAAPAALRPRADDDLAALLYTGGTTGRAKGVMLSHRNLQACARSGHAAARAEGVTDGLTRTLMPLPLSHAYGLIVTLIGWHAVEPQLAVLQRWFDPAQWVELAQRYRVQRTTLVPSMMQMLLAQPLEEADLSELRYVTSGAAPLPPETRAAWEERVPGCRIMEGYGCTESGSVIATTRPGRERPGSVGEPLPDFEVEIRDDEGLAVPAGVAGEICVRSAGVMRGYWKSPDLTARTVRDEWLYTGDIGRLDADGFLYVLDRKKDLILRGGFNVYPRDVEDVLLAHPDVASAGVVGRPDVRLGEEVVAYVTLRPEASVGPRELIEHCRGRLAAHKYPRQVEVLEQLPLTRVGKLDRTSLRDLARAPREAAESG
ncbi:Long-chain-fatty-acid--CoA ligase [Streptomyces sp. YIM 130001]|uniref:class I adenylate-forming enzyme family protein n=1 Tax=Streptomyces sp. YIM 130001 TaxID=2259644 RepID=UPI000E64BACE|nr:AMP-binding protein [Streptomyces sp. YIM 130001]RII14773.1 Long-chain-fatty-acid--CoA ligase [Streptomyces sp. YIM 130001]